MTARDTAGNPRLHHFLGYAGLAPFVVCAATVLLGHSPEIRTQALEAMMFYAAVVASFIGAVHWGVWLVEYPDTRSARLGWGVLPALAGWALLIVPASWALPGFITLYLLMALVDLRLLPLPYLGFLGLRRNLSLAVLICLVLVTPFASGLSG